MSEEHPPITAGGTALLVIDMQNGFCHPDGSFAKMTAGRGLSIEMCSEAVPGCDHLIQAARSAHVPVIFTRYVYHAGYVDGGVLAQKYPEMEQIGSLSDGSWDAEIVHELVPEQGDFVIDKSRYSAFYGTRLEPLLNGLGVRSLILQGSRSHCPCLSHCRGRSARAWILGVRRGVATKPATQPVHMAILAEDARRALVYELACVLGSPRFARLGERLTGDGCGRRVVAVALSSPPRFLKQPRGKA